jgi:hypothetical protein
MKAKKKKVIMSRLVPLADDKRDFDLLFWQRVGDQGIFEAAWEMVLDLAKWKQPHGNKSRLRRTIASLKLRQG